MVHIQRTISNQIKICQYVTGTSRKDNSLTKSRKDQETTTFTTASKKETNASFSNSLSLSAHWNHLVNRT